MKSSLWIVIVLVTGIVGFLVGYSVSSSTGTARAPAAGGHAVKAGGAAQPGGGYGGAAEPAAAKTSSGGYK